MKYVLHVAVELVGGDYHCSFTTWEVTEESETTLKGVQQTHKPPFKQEHLFTKAGLDKLVFNEETLGFMYYQCTSDIENLAMLSLETEVRALNALFDQPDYETGEPFNKQFFDACDRRITMLTS